MGRNGRRIEARNERLSIHLAEPRSSPGTHAGAPLAGRVVHVVRGLDRNSTRNRDCPSSRVEQAGPGERKHYSNHTQPRALWISAPCSVARRPRRPPGDSGPHSLCAAARDPQHLHGNPRRRPGSGGSRTGHGTHRLPTAVSGAVAAVSQRDFVGCASRDRDLGRPRDHCGRHRGRRTGRVYLSRPGYGEQSTHPGWGNSRCAARSAGGSRRGMAGKAFTATMKMLGGTHCRFGGHGNFTVRIVNRSNRLVLTLSAVILLVSSSCAPSHSDRIVIGSKNFTESLILGELVAQQIEAQTHLRVERRFYLAGTYICQQAMLAGRIDIYPEYTGTALTAILKREVGGDKGGVYQRVKSEYESRYKLTLGPPFGFNDTFAMEIRGDDARRLGLKTLSQVASYTPKWRAGFG